MTKTCSKCGSQMQPPANQTTDYISSWSCSQCGTYEWDGQQEGALVSVVPQPPVLTFRDVSSKVQSESTEKKSLGYHWTSTPGLRCDCFLLSGGRKVELVYVDTLNGQEREVLRATHCMGQIQGLLDEMGKYEN